MARQVKVLLLGQLNVVMNPEHTPYGFARGSADNLFYLKEQGRVANPQS